MKNLDISSIQKTVDDLGLTYPVKEFEDLCKICLDNDPLQGTEFLTSQLGELMVQVSPFIKKIASSNGGMFALFGLMQVLADNRWGMVFAGNCSDNKKVTPDQIMTCLHYGISGNAIDTVTAFCQIYKTNSSSSLFCTAFFNKLYDPKPWSINGLTVALSCFNSFDKEFLPKLVRYSRQLQVMANAHTGEERQLNLNICKIVQHAISRVDVKWWQFWKFGK